MSQPVIASSRRSWACPFLVGGRPRAEANVRSPRFRAARGFLPDAEDVAGRVGEERNPERAFRVGRRDDLPAMGGDGGERAVDIGDVDVGAQPVGTGDGLIGDPASDDVAGASLKLGPSGLPWICQPNTSR